MLESDIAIFLKKKKRSFNVVVNDKKIFQRIKNKGQFKEINLECKNRVFFEFLLSASGYSTNKFFLHFYSIEFIFYFTLFLFYSILQSLEYKKILKCGNFYEYKKLVTVKRLLQVTSFITTQGKPHRNCRELQGSVYIQGLLSDPSLYVMPYKSQILKVKQYQWVGKFYGKLGY